MCHGAAGSGLVHYPEAMPDAPDGLRFAVYLCPPATDPFYQLGSAVLGHDVRAGRTLPLPAFIRPEWQREAGPYGFHLTLVEAFSTLPERWAALEAELAACYACLSPQANLHLTGGRLERWQGQVLAWRLEASPDLKLFQTLLAARLAPFAVHSPFDDEVAEHPQRYAAPHERACLRLFGTPRVLDRWQPHFTLVQPFQGDEVEARELMAELDRAFSPYREQAVTSLALFRKEAGQERWQVARDFPLPAPYHGERDGADHDAQATGIH